MEKMDLNLKATELTLGLPGSDCAEPRGSKRGAEAAEEAGQKASLKAKTDDLESVAPPAKTQVVGWPPVRSFRRNALMANKKAETEAAGGMYVKVSMDGAPYLRKIDLNLYKGYKELLSALENMFKCFTIGELSGKESCSKSEYALTYEDKDGDWMLVGDVPFEMFISSCKRLRIMKGSEARGLGCGL